MSLTKLGDLAVCLVYITLQYKLHYNTAKQSISSTHSV